MKYRIHWKSVLTDNTGHGAATYYLEEVVRHIARLNNQNYGITTHWIEPVDEDGDNDD